MLYNYNEILVKYKDDYKIKKAIRNREIFKIEKGLYSDKENMLNIADNNWLEMPIDKVIKSILKYLEEFEKLEVYK